MSSKNAMLVTILILLVGCIPVATVQGTIVANKPTYSAGDYWEYQDSVTGNTQKLVVGNGTVSFGGQTCIAVDTQTTVNRATSNMTVYYRASDQAEVGSYMVNSASGANTKTTTLDDPPASQYHFPMKVGDAWRYQTVYRITSVSSSGSHHTTTYYNQSVDINYTVDSEEKVTVAAGTFDTLKITAHNAGTSNSGNEWYAPKVGHGVKQSATFSATYIELKSYKFKNGPSGGGSSMISSATMLYVLIIVIVIILVVVLVVMKKKKPAPVQPGMATSVAPAQTPQAPPEQPQYLPPRLVPPEKYPISICFS